MFSEKYNSSCVRIYYFDELDQAVPRMVTVAYRFDPKSGCVMYGGCMFTVSSTKDNSTCTCASIRSLFKKEPNRQTAIQRLEKKPVLFRVDETVDGTDSLLVAIRLAIRKFGMSSQHKIPIMSLRTKDLSLAKGLSSCASSSCASEPVSAAITNTNSIQEEVPGSAAEMAAATLVTTTTTSELPETLETGSGMDMSKVKGKANRVKASSVTSSVSKLEEVSRRSQTVN